MGEVHDILEGLLLAPDGTVAIKCSSEDAELLGRAIHDVKIIEKHGIHYFNQDDDNYFCNICGEYRVSMVHKRATP